MDFNGIYLTSNLRFEDGGVHSHGGTTIAGKWTIRKDG